MGEAEPPRNYSRIKNVISPKDYIRKLLCGNIGCDITDASATLLYDNTNNKWSYDLISSLGFASVSFPKPAYPYEIAGYINKGGSDLTSLRENTPVVFGGGDQPMQAAANGIIFPGQMSLTIGTGGQLLYAAGIETKGESGAVSSFYHAAPGMKYFLAATLGACLSLNWFCDKIISDNDYKTLDEAARRVPPGSGGVVFLPHLTGERTPYMNPEARGVFWGISLDADRTYLYRAVMEGVAYSICGALEELGKQVIIPDEIISVGGALKSSLWAQICADALNRTLHITALTEPSAAGAALCAGVGCGIFASIDEGYKAFNRNNSYEIYTPDAGNSAIYKRGFEVYKKLYRQTGVIQNPII